MNETTKAKVPIWEKANLTIEEAAGYFNMGTDKIRKLTDDKNCTCVLWNGSKRLIKRKPFEDYLNRQFSI